jgi:hypothetical protein
MDTAVEERFKKLERTIKSQDKKIRTLEDVHQIQNLMSRYIYMHEVHRDPEFLDLFFSKREDISWEVAHFGIFKGRKSVKKALDIHGLVGDKPGMLFMHTLTTPVIEIAGDGKTAKAVWISPGAETQPDPKLKRIRGCWAWSKYGCDYVKEDGAWKLWHYHVYRVMLAPSDMDYCADWERENFPPPSEQKNMLTAVLPGLIPDAKPTFDNPFNKDFFAKMVPAPPEPYETFDKTFTYGDPKKG